MDPTPGQAEQSGFETYRYPRYLRDMNPIEAAFTGAMHDLGCADEEVRVVAGVQVGGPHPLTDHEPFEVETGDRSWEEYTAALAGRGLALVSVDSITVALGTCLRRRFGDRFDDQNRAVARELFGELIADHEHQWVAARNEAVTSGEMCPACGAVRDTPLERDISAQVGHRVVRLER